MKTVEPENKHKNRMNQLYDWGMNCRLFGLCEAKTLAHLNSACISRPSHRDMFWQGYHAVPTRDYLVEIQSKWMMDYP